MIKDLLYLWKNRERPTVFSRWLRVWLKRIYHISSLSRLIVGSMILRLKGASIGRLVVLGKSQISGNFSNLVIGNESSLGRCELMLHDQIIIGSRVVINDGVRLITASHSLISPEWELKKKPISIGDYAWIATDAIILPGIKIGTGAVVAAGSIVRCDVPDYALAVGNPAKVYLNRRAKKLHYCAVLFNAPYEAWVGPHVKNKDSSNSE